MIIESFYLSELNTLDRVETLTGLAKDEIESLVGRFTNRSHRAGKLRGEVVIYANLTIKIRHHFTKSKIFWKGMVQ